MQSRGREKVGRPKNGNFPRSFPVKHGRPGTRKIAKNREKKSENRQTTINFGYPRDVNLRTRHLTIFQPVIIGARRKNV